MNYIGSKKKLRFFISETIKDVTGNTSQMLFADIFAGTGIISNEFKGKVKKIIANDSEFYSYVLLKNYIGNHKQLDYQDYIKELNNLSPVKGFIYKNYCLGGSKSRLYFSDYNGMKIDAIRMKIEELFRTKSINSNLYYFLLASLLESADKVANTASVYGAFLKKIKNSAKQNLILEPAIFQFNDSSHQVHNDDANNLISKLSGDILYLDPPYNHRQYGANYHLLNTIAKYDTFIPKGKTGLRNYFRSDYCNKNRVALVLEELLSKANFKYVFLSYNSEGLLSFEEIKRIMSKYGHYEVQFFNNYPRYKADNNRQYKRNKTTEYLHILEKKL